MKKTVLVFLSLWFISLVGIAQTTTNKDNGTLTNASQSYINFIDDSPRTRSIATATYQC